MANGLRLRFGAEIMAIKFGNSITGKLLFFDISVLNMEPSSLFWNYFVVVFSAALNIKRHFNRKYQLGMG